MMTIDHDDLTNVTGGQQLARRTSALDSPTFVPPGLRPDQITTEQFKADLHARVNIRFSADAAAEIRQARPWVTPEQASDPEYIKGFMVPWY
jgi:hypothetical protein